MGLIISSTSPLSGFKAQVFTENDCSYLYLFPSESTDAPIATCWIKNHVKVGNWYSAQNDMKKGLQPKVSTKHCNFHKELHFLKEEELEIVWGKEGISVALYEGDEPICIMPYWVDRDHEFVGYSKYSATSELMRGIPLPLGGINSDSSDTETVTNKMAEARKFWKQDFHRIWENYSSSYLQNLESKYGKHIKYYAIDGGEFPPKALVVFEKGNVRYAFTLGIGIFPQPQVELYREHFENYRDHEFFEIGFCYRVNSDFDEMKVFSQISSIVKIPWLYNTFLALNHTVEFTINERFKNAVLIADRGVNIAQMEFLKENNINLLWLVPIDDEVFGRLNAERAEFGYVKTKFSNEDILYEG